MKIPDLGFVLQLTLVQALNVFSVQTLGDITVLPKTAFIESLSGFKDGVYKVNPGVIHLVAEGLIAYPVRISENCTSDIVKDIHVNSASEWPKIKQVKAEGLLSLCFYDSESHLEPFSRLQIIVEEYPVNNLTTTVINEAFLSYGQGKNVNIEFTTSLNTETYNLLGTQLDTIDDLLFVDIEVVNIHENFQFEMRLVNDNKLQKAMVAIDTGNPETEQVHNITMDLMECNLDSKICSLIVVIIRNDTLESCELFINGSIVLELTDSESIISFNFTSDIDNGFLSAAINLTCIDNERKKYSTNLEIDFLELKIITFEEPNTTIANGLSEIHFASLDNLTNYQSFIRQFDPFLNLYDKTVEIPLNCSIDERLCTWVNPEFVASDTIQELCVYFIFYKTYYSRCKFFLLPDYRVYSTKELYKLDHSFDSLFPVKFEVLFKTPIYYDIPIISWITYDGDMTLHGSPAEQIFNNTVGEKFSMYVVIRTIDTFTAIIPNITFLTKTGINATMDVLSKQSPNTPTKVSVNIIERGSGGCFFLKFGDHVNGTYTNETIGIKYPDTHTKECESALIGELPMNNTNSPMNNTNSPMNNTNSPMNNTNSPMNNTNLQMNNTNLQMNNTNFRTNLTASTMNSTIIWIEAEKYRFNGENLILTIEYNYTTEGIYLITFLAFNSDNHYQIQERKVIVTLMECNSPKITLLGCGINELLSVDYKRSESILIESNVHIDCNESAIYNSVWKMYIGSGFAVTLSPAKVQFRAKDLMIPSQLLPYGVVRVCLLVSMNINENIYREECGFIRITATSLSAVLTNGNEVRRGSNSKNIVDASLSRNLDSGDLKDVHVFFICRSVEDDEAVELRYENINELPYVVPSETNATTHVHGCYGNGVGKIKPDIGKHQITLDPNYMAAHKPFEITLFMWKKDEGILEPRTANATQIITFVPSVPSLFLKCIDNCGQNINQAYSQSLEAVCSSGCIVTPEYYWFLYSCPSSKGVNCSNIEDAEFDAIRVTDRATRFYASKRNSYKVDQWYKISLRAQVNESFAEVSMIFLVNSPPRGGSCSIDKASGIALSTSFRVFCTGWLDDNLPLKYRLFILDESVQREVYSGFLSDLTIYLPMGDPELEYKLTVLFSIVDSKLSSTSITKIVQVFPPANVTSVIGSIRQSLVNGTSGYLEAVNSYDLNAASDHLRLITSILKETSCDEKDPEQKLDVDFQLKSIQIRSVLLQGMVKFADNVINLPKDFRMKQINKIIGTIGSVTEISSELEESGQKLLMNVLESAVAMAEVSNENIDGIITIAAGITSVVADLAEVCSAPVGFQGNFSSNETVKDCYAVIMKLTDDTKLFKENCLRRINESSEFLQRLTTKLSKSVMPGAGQVSINTKKHKVGVTKILPNAKTAGAAVGQVKAGFNMSSIPGAEFVTAKLKNIKKNIYTSDESAERVKSQITGFEISSENGEVNDIDVVLTIANNPIENKTKPENVSMSVEEDGQWSYHTIFITNTSLRVKVEIFNNTLSLNAYLRKDKFPTLEKYDYIFTIPDNSSCKWVDEGVYGDLPIDLREVDPLDVKCQFDPNVIFISDCEELDGTYILGFHYVYPEVNETNTPTATESHVRERRSCNEPIDVKEVDEDVCVVVLPPPPTPEPTLPPGSYEPILPVITNYSIKYNVDITLSKCLFWNTTLQVWSSNGCIVGPNTTPESTECICNHLTDFGGELLVAPAPIDFSKVFAGLKNLADNLGVLIVILTILLLYVLFTVWARRKDQYDKEQRTPVVVDCRKGSKKDYSYLVTVVTGAGFGAGTTANVYFTLSGSDGDSKIIPMKATDDRKIFQARTITTFQILLSESVGDLNYIRIFHDNSGRNPSWYLRNVVITDLTTKIQYPFVYDDWLAVESRSGQIDVNLPVASDKDLAGFHIVFASTAAKGLLDGHIWFSVFTRPLQSTFTRVQRASCCLCLIYLTMVTNAMFFGAGEAGPKILLRLGNMVINITGIIIGIEASLIVIPPSMFVIEVFRRLAPPKKTSIELLENSNNEDVADLALYEEAIQQDTQTDQRRKTKKGPFQFPYYFKYIAYVVIFLSSFGSALFTFFYSMMWGPKKSNQWLGSMFAGFFQSVFVIQPVKAAFLAALFALIIRKPVVQNHVSQGDEDDKSIDIDLEDTEDGDSNGDGVISAIEVPVVLPSDSVLDRARKRKLRERVTGKIVKDIVTYFLFLFVVFVLSYSEKDKYSYWFRKDLENIFTNAKYENSMRLADASNPANFYLWLRDTLIPGIYVGPWYNNDLPKSFKFISNREALLISIPRMRQQRVQSDSCQLHTSVKTLFNGCESSYSFSREDTLDYEVGWRFMNTSQPRTDTSWVVTKTNSSSEANKRVRRAVYKTMKTGKGASLRRRRLMKDASSHAVKVFFVDPAALLPDGSVISCSKRWRHFTMTELRGFPVVGKFAIYDGSGYVANLGYNEETGWTVIADLHSHNWIDSRTRAVFVEFTVYNANINLFATAFLYMEFLSVGAGVPSSDFKIFNGYRYALNANLGSRVLELVFVSFVIYFFVVELKKFWKLKMAYIRGFFNIIEIVLLPLYLVMFGLIIYRWLSTAKNIKTFHDNPKDYVSFQYSAEADVMLQVVIGIVTFLLNIKFLKYFQFAKSFYEMGLVMNFFFRPLMGFMVSFFVLFVMFAGAANLGFGSQSEHYHTFMRTCVTQFLHLLGATDFEEAQRSGGVIFGPLYYCVYSMFVMVISLNVLMAIICGAIDEDFEEEFEKNLGDVQFVEYFMIKFKNLTGFGEVDKIESEPVENVHYIKQNYEIIDRKMKELEDIIEVFFKQFELFEVAQEDDVTLSQMIEKQVMKSCRKPIYAWT